MSNLVVAVKSCHRDHEAGFHDVIRETWGQDLTKAGVQVRFFMGEDPNLYKGSSKVLKRDEIIVGSPDDYNSLPKKTRGITQWAMSKKIDHLFLCDNDTIINAKGLLSLPYEPFDYAGHFKGGQSELGHTFFYEDHRGRYPECYAWASGGMGYFLSRRAAEVVANEYPSYWAEDMYVGQCLGPDIQKGLMLGAALTMADIATWHFRKSEKYPKFTPELLRRIYRDGSPEKVYAE